MLTANTQNSLKTETASKQRFYRIIGEGYKAMNDGRVSSIDEVREKLKVKREQHG